MPTSRFSRDRFRGDVQQFGAVVIGFDLDAGKQASGGGIVEFLDLGLDVLEGGQGLLVLAHQHDALHAVVVIVANVGEGETGTGVALAIGLPIADPPSRVWLLTTTPCRLA